MAEQLNSIYTVMPSLCPFCQKEYASLRSVESHRRLCKQNPNRSKSPFENAEWQKQKGTNQYIKAQQLGIAAPTISEETRKKLSDAIKARPKKDGVGLKWFRQRCAFTFNVYNYPEEFELPLIEKYGWYSASNHGGNLNGVTRDHMLSVRFAYDNGIDPKLVSHPANCRLLVHKENVSKYSKCSITLEELKQRIVEWETKYGPVV